MTVVRAMSDDDLKRCGLKPGHCLRLKLALTHTENAGRGTPDLTAPPGRAQPSGGRWGSASSTTPPSEQVRHTGAEGRPGGQQPKVEWEDASSGEMVTSGSLGSRLESSSESAAASGFKRWALPEFTEAGHEVFESSTEDENKGRLSRTQRRSLQRMKAQAIRDKESSDPVQAARADALLQRTVMALRGSEHARPSAAAAGSSRDAAAAGAPSSRKGPGQDRSCKLHL